MPILVSLLVAFLGVSNVVGAEPKISPSKERLIRQFLEVSDAKEGAADVMVDVLARRMGVPLPPEEAREEFREHPRISQITEETLIPIYDRYFTEEQLRDMIKFFDSETGKHYVQAERKIEAESRKSLEAATTRYTEESAERARAHRTRNDFRGLGVALSSYFSEHKSYPAARSTDELSALLPPKSIVPSEDGWGHPIRYSVSDDRQHYRLVSAGADGVFSQSPTAGDDIVFTDGRFVHGGEE